VTDHDHDHDRDRHGATDADRDGTAPDPDRPTAESTGRSTGSAGPSARETVSWDLPAGAPAHECERCGRPFADPDFLALHRGLAHWTDLSEPERETYWSAVETERADLRRFRIVALGGLVVLYFGFLILYAVAT
jgi:hypothetical protein